MRAVARALGGASVVALAALVTLSAEAGRAKEVCDAKTVAAYVEAHRGEVKATCFDPRKSQRNLPAEVKMKAHLTYDANGTVDNVSIVQGANPLLAPCVVGKLRTWHPPCGPDKIDVEFDWRK